MMDGRPLVISFGKAVPIFWSAEMKAVFPVSSAARASDLSLIRLLKRSPRMIYSTIAKIKAVPEYSWKNATTTGVGAPRTVVVP